MKIPVLPIKDPEGLPDRSSSQEGPEPLPPQTLKRTQRTNWGWSQARQNEQGKREARSLTHFRRCPATEGWAVSCPRYMASEAQREMAWCIRYCTASILTTAAPCFSARRSIRLRDSPASAALCPKGKTN